MTTFSYSSIKEFDQCPRKYHRKRICKDVVDVPGPEAEYGTAVHTAAEEFIRDKKPIPEKYRYMEPILQALEKLDGDKYTELKFAVRMLNDGYEPCDFFAKDAYVRGIADLLIVNGPQGILLDYKTGKNSKYADIKQLDLMAGCAFVHYPQLEVIKSGLVFVVAGDLISKIHYVEKTNAYLKVFRHELIRLVQSEKSNLWPPNPGPLCPWCPVHDCEFWSERKSRG
jgi:hypothetical protein